jgi:hypothetical protein
MTVHHNLACLSTSRSWCTGSIGAPPIHSGPGVGVQFGDVTHLAAIVLPASRALLTVHNHPPPFAQILPNRFSSYAEHILMSSASDAQAHSASCCPVLPSWHASPRLIASGWSGRMVPPLLPRKDGYTERFRLPAWSLAYPPSTVARVKVLCMLPLLLCTSCVRALVFFCAHGEMPVRCARA